MSKILKRYWKTLYHRFDCFMNTNERITDELSILNNNTSCLNEHAKLLEKVIYHHVKKYNTKKLLINNIKITLKIITLLKMNRVILCNIL